MQLGWKASPTQNFETLNKVRIELRLAIKVWRPGTSRNLRLTNVGYHWRLHVADMPGNAPMSITEVLTAADWTGRSLFLAPSVRALIPSLTSRNV